MNPCIQLDFRGIPSKARIMCLMRLSFVTPSWPISVLLPVPCTTLGNLLYSEEANKRREVLLLKELRLREGKKGNQGFSRW